MCVFVYFRDLEASPEECLRILAFHFIRWVARLHSDSYHHACDPASMGLPAKLSPFWCPSCPLSPKKKARLFVFLVTKAI